MYGARGLLRRLRHLGEALQQCPVVEFQQVEFGQYAVIQCDLHRLGNHRSATTVDAFGEKVSQAEHADDFGKGVGPIHAMLDEADNQTVVVLGKAARDADVVVVGETGKEAIAARIVEQVGVDAGIAAGRSVLPP